MFTEVSGLQVSGRCANIKKSLRREGTPMRLHLPPFLTKAKLSFVVGLLLAALYDPVWTGAIHGKADFALALGLFSLLVYARCPPFWVAVMGAAGGALLGWMPS